MQLRYLSSYVEDLLGDYYTIRDPKDLPWNFIKIFWNRQIEELLKTLQGYQRIHSQVLGNKYKVFYFSSLNSNRLYNNFTALMEQNKISYKINNQSTLQINFF